MEEYIFNDSRETEEWERLRSIEAIFDPATRRQLTGAGLGPGWRCLEVGPGAGSVARWMSESVGPSGRVIAVDTDTRFLRNLHAPNLEILKADIGAIELEHSTFDVAHARYVLIHLPRYKQAFEKMVKGLKPGGWIVVEEPDFSAAQVIAGNQRDREAVGRVNRAIEKMFVGRGMDHTLGARLPALFQKAGLRSISVENEASPVQGGSGLAAMMKRSAIHLREKYIATGEATAEDIERYGHFAEDRQSLAVYYATVRVRAQKQSPTDA